MEHGTSAIDLTASDRRRWLRYPAEDLGTVTVDHSGELYSGVRLQDISLGGLRLEFGEALPIGSEVMISHPVAGTICGTVAWQEAGQTGIAVTEDESRRSYTLRLVCIVLHAEGHKVTG